MDRFTSCKLRKCTLLIFYLVYQILQLSVTLIELIYLAEFFLEHLQHLGTFSALLSIMNPPELVGNIMNGTLRFIPQDVSCYSSVRTIANLYREGWHTCKLALSTQYEVVFSLQWAFLIFHATVLATGFISTLCFFFDGCMPLIEEANVADEIALQQFEKQGKKFEEFLGCDGIWVLHLIEHHSCKATAKSFAAVLFAFHIDYKKKRQLK